MNKKLNVKFYQFAKQFLIEHLPQGIELDSYYKIHKAQSLKEIFIIFIASAQQYQHMTNVIQFVNRYDELKAILYDFDYHKIALLNVDDLYKTLRNKFAINSQDNKRNSWYKWSCSIVDSAKFISQYNDLNDFEAFINSFSYNADTRLALPLVIATKIKGIAFALACNALKEIGYVDYPKPDVHLMDICESLNICERNEYKTFQSIIQIANDNNVSAYEVDKTLWLICSGKFYNHNINVKSYKKEFIKECGEFLHNA